MFKLKIVWTISVILQILFAYNVNVLFWRKSQPFLLDFSIVYFRPYIKSVSLFKSYAKVRKNVP